MFANKEEVKAWLYANEEYIRYNDPTPGVEDKVILILMTLSKDNKVHNLTEEQAIAIMQSYLLPF